MLDLAPAYDVIVIDNPEDPAPLSVPTEALVPLILKPNGLHKTPPDEAETSCGEQWHMGTDSRIAAVDWLKGYKLCEVCFTPHERAKADAARKERVRLATDENEPIRLREWLEDPSRPNNPRRKK
jgi:hypothetical protein